MKGEKRIIIKLPILLQQFFGLNMNRKIFHRMGDGLNSKNNFIIKAAVPDLVEWFLVLKNRNRNYSFLQAYGR